MLVERGIPYFSLDVLMMGLAAGLPTFGLDPDTSGIVRGEKFWPILRAMAVNLLEEERVHPEYLVEGDELLPKYVAELRAAYPERVRACFLGYREAVPEEKLRAVRSVEPDWMAYCPEAEMLSFVAGEVEQSAYLERECARHGLRYFDCSRDLPSALNDAARYLLGSEP